MSRAPGVTHLVPLPYGQFGAFLRDPLGYQLRARERFGDVFRFRLGPMLLHYVWHPDHVRHVLIDRAKNYVRGWQYRVLRGLAGDNLVTSDGDYWRRQRRLAQPAFHRQRLAGYADVMADAVSQALARWDALVGRPIDIASEMARLTLAIAGRTLFDRDVSGEADAVGRAFTVVARHLERRLNRPFTTPPGWLPTPANRRFGRALRDLNGLVLGLVRDRRGDGRDHGDLLSMLLRATDDETGEAMTDAQVRGEALAFLLAGHETTATALTWAWYLLASHPDVQERVRAEVTGNGQELPLTRMVIDEALRLYPPVWATPRQAAEADAIGGFPIPAGSTVVLCQYVTHRHPDVWKRPDEFDPERFTPERVAGRPKGAYFPFLAGPHQCIGNEFALLEMRLVLAMTLRRFRVELASAEPVRPAASIVLRPAGPVNVVLREVTS